VYVFAKLRCICYRTDHILQLYTVPVQISSCDDTCNVPARIVVSGKIGTTQKDIHTFTMTIWEPLIQVPQAHLNIRGLIGLNSLLSHPIPSLNSFVTCSRTLLAVEERVAQVALNIICCLHMPPTHCPVRHRGQHHEETGV
jgi:hypothetical protein